MIKVRAVRQCDKEWIVNLLQAGARDGHFSAKTEQNAEMLFDRVINKTWWVSIQERYGQIRPEFQFLNICVADVDGIPAGFSLCTTNPEETEILVVAIKPEFRQQGCFRALVNHKIKQFESIALLNLLPQRIRSWAFKRAMERAHPDQALSLHWHWCGKGNRLLSRCYPKSAIAISAFQKIGFVVTPHNGKVVELTWMQNKKPKGSASH